MSQVNHGFSDAAKKLLAGRNQIKTKIYVSREKYRNSGKPTGRTKEFSSLEEMTEFITHTMNVAQWTMIDTYWAYPAAEDNREV
jgi:hypothetical protein